MVANVNGSIIPYLKKGQTIGDWGKEFTAACASLDDKQSLKLLPQYASRDVGTKEFAYVACENPDADKTLAAALSELDEFVEGKQTRLAKSVKFFDVVLEDVSTSGQTKYFLSWSTQGWVQPFLQMSSCYASSNLFLMVLNSLRNPKMV